MHDVRPQEDLDVGMSESEMARHRLPPDSDVEPRFPREVRISPFLRPPAITRHMSRRECAQQEQ